ncbi:Eco57I restriction-modification methylase domain-containing protein [Candidatus Dependentiae bacterium]|nr:Eco57I restriction-modification methylase domain-containing protein [Candidatus Dependentiae bacterium]
MSNIKNYIFNRKILDRLLEKEEEGYLKFFNNFNDNLEEYADRIKSGKIYKFSELEFQETFLTEVFEEVLGYTYITHAKDEWNLRREQTTRLDSSKPDAIIGFGGFDKGSEADVRGVIELKSAGTDLDAKQSGHGNQTPVEQAFSYASKFGKNCRWVIVSNFIEIRLYNYSDQGEYETFDLREMNDNYEEFQRFYFLLHKDNLIKKEGLSRIEKLYQENTEEEEKISQKFYQEYKQLRIHLFQHIRNNNPDIEPLTALEKTQKVIDRFIFVCFCEDKGLLEDRIFRYIIEHTTPGFSKWDAVKGLFRAINKGDPNNNINKFNGGLFEEDAILDHQIKLDDEIFEEMARITDWDFDSELNVNILGHIFEKSISDIEELKAEIEGEIVDKKKGKRKKEGIYYTPDYITKYIVENAVGGWLEDRKKELDIEKLPELIDKDFESIKIKKRKIESNARIKKHLAFWEAYKQKLMNIKVLDPACGSGAFLNQAFDYLYKEGQKVNENISRLQGGQMTIFDLDKHILTNNIFGVDLNSESVEITKLSMWLKTANKGKELTFLDDNIKCGNSLIDDPEIAGDKAFKWEEEFKEIMDSGGFDVVIGNPPYISGLQLSKKMNKLENKYIKNKYKSASGSFDIYVIFIELGLNLLNENGIISFITPNKYLSAPYGKMLRSLIFKEHKIIEILDLSKVKVFDDPSIYPIIFTFSKFHNEDYYIRAKVGIENLGKIEYYEKMINSNIICNIPEYIFAPIFSKNINILEKALNKSVYLKDIAEINATSTAKEADLFSEEISENLVGKKIINTGTIDRYIFLWGIKEMTNKGNKYLNPFLNIENIQLSKHRKYIYDSPKIILAKLAIRIEAALDYQGDYASINTNCIYKPNHSVSLEYLLLLLNSKLISFIYKELFGALSMSGSYLQFQAPQIKNIPIILINEHKQEIFILKSKKIVKLYHEYYSVIKKYFKFLEELYNINISKLNITKFEKYKFSKFLKILKDSHVVLNKKDEFELMELFEEQKEKALELKREIDKTDNEINQMVYELYGLTEEEIKIVEDGIK